VVAKPEQSAESCKSGNPQRGDVLQLYVGMRTTACEKIS
jgi:hypothetical protein